ncbi:MAG: hypothetical protein H0V66_14040 [Bdellovibrionales bacterium]|nr:hypothetical protein [Bdellovibrionales bacterium]
MKTLFVLCSMLFAASSFAAVIAVCHSPNSDQSITVVREDHSTPTWESITLKWNRKDGRNSFRQFVNSEINQNDDRKLVLSQNSMFLGMGQKTTFTLDKRKGLAKLTGKVGGSGIQIGDGPHINTEPSGRINIKFSECEISE